MFIELTPEQRQLQPNAAILFGPDLARQYKMEADRHGKAYRAVIKRMGSDGKLGVGWPKELVPGVRPDRTADLRQRGTPGRCRCLR